MINQSGSGMSFKNEYVNAMGDEDSEFLRNAKSLLRTGFNDFDTWVVDRSRDMVLFRIGSGHDVDNYDSETWKFIEGTTTYYITTKAIESTKISDQIIAMTRAISFLRDAKYGIPEAETILHIKEALSEHKDLGLFSTYERCHLTLLNVRGEEI